MKKRSPSSDKEVMKGSPIKWGQFTNPTICVDDDIQLDGLVELSTVTNLVGEP